MQFPKSRIFEICLMEAVKHQPVLYDRDCVGYSIKQDIDRAWEIVLAEVSKKVKDINVTHCKLRWRSLRDRYVKQFVKTTNGAIVEPDLSKWAYNAQLNFLRKHLKKRKFGSDKPPSPKKTRYSLPATTIPSKRIKSSSPRPRQQQTSAVVVESITQYNENEQHSCSDSSTTAYEQDIQVEIDSLDDYDCPIEAEEEAEVAEIEFVPFVPKRKTSITTTTTPQLPENPIPEVSNEVVVDPFPQNETNQTVESNIVNDNNDDNDDDQANGLSLSTNTTTTATTTEECINNLMITVNNLLKAQQKNEALKSSNEEYFKVLDGLLSKLPTEELDKAKVDILNFVLNKTKAMQRRTLY